MKRRWFASEDPTSLCQDVSQWADICLPELISVRPLVKTKVVVFTGGGVVSILTRSGLFPSGLEKLETQ
jgi:hypothetical protein